MDGIPNLNIYIQVILWEQFYIRILGLRVRTNEEILKFVDNRRSSGQKFTFELKIGSKLKWQVKKFKVLSKT